MPPVSNDAAEAAGAAVEAARADSAKTRASLGETEAALKKAEAADEAAWMPFRAAESAARQLEAEVKGLEKLAPPEARKFPPVLASIEVEAGYERALAAALGDDIDASLHADAPSRWAGAEAPKVQLPAQADSLTRFVKAPPALAARLALIGVIEAKDGAALAKQLTPGARLVSREGDLWRWDGFVRRADAPQPAAARLEHKNRLAAARKEVEAAEARLHKAKAAWEKAKAERTALEETARKLRAEAPRRAAAEAEAGAHPGAAGDGSDPRARAPRRSRQPDHHARHPKSTKRAAVSRKANWRSPKRRRWKTIPTSPMPAPTLTKPAPPPPKRAPVLQRLRANAPAATSAAARSPRKARNGRRASRHA